MRKRMYWNMEVEPVLNTPQMQELQLKKIQKLVQRLYGVSLFWKNRMDKAKVKPGDIKTLGDFSQRIPVFDKAQRRELFDYYDGDMVKVVAAYIGTHWDELRLMGCTSGSTGEPTTYPHTKRDIEWLTECMSRMLWRIGVRPNSRILHAFGLSMFLAGVPYAMFFQGIGACVFPVGAESGTERVLQFAKYFKPDTLSCTPSLAEYLIEKAPETIGVDVKDLGFKRLFCAGEPGAGVPEVRQKIESAYGAVLFDHGAALGISCDCPEYQGMHHVSDDYVYMELVDQKTLEPIPFEDGAIGVSVQTTLEGEGFVWFRESFGDIFQVFTEPCPCGQSGFRYKVVGRIDDMLKVKGVIVYPASIAGVITGFAPRVTGEFRIVLDEPPPRVVPPLKLKIEYGEGQNEAAIPNLEQEIKEALRSKLKITPQIEWLAPKTLERFTYKAKIIEKTYDD